MSESESSWESLRSQMKQQGYRMVKDSPEIRAYYANPSECPNFCLETPQMRQFVKGDETKSYLYCPQCGLVWDPASGERFE